MKYIRSQQEILNLISQRFPIQGDKIPPEEELVQILGVSIITVRRALKELAERGVLERIQGKGTFVKQSLAVGKPMAKALIIVTKGPLDRYGEMIFEAQYHLRKRGYDCGVMLCEEMPDGNISEAISSASGVLITGVVNDHWVKFLEAMRVPFVVLGGSQSSSAIWRVDWNWRGAVKNMVDLLHQKKFIKIGLINGSKDYYGAQECYRGFCERMSGLEIFWEEDWICWDERKSNERWLDSYFEKHDGFFDALIVECGIFIDVLLWMFEREYHKKNLFIGLISNRILTTKKITNLQELYFFESLVSQGVELLFRVMGNTKSCPQTIFLDAQFK